MNNSPVRSRRVTPRNFDEEGGPKTVGWLSPAKTGKSLACFVDDEYCGFVSIAMVEKYVRGEIKAIPIKRFPEGEENASSAPAKR